MGWARAGRWDQLRETGGPAAPRRTWRSTSSCCTITPGERVPLLTALTASVVIPLVLLPLTSRLEKA
ncbi:hypothetical protein ACTMTI_50285 [Nonomuraea sp. H19]|uniref:hypothetical protein n=1 Tax=Nonomuraea sp. H19 TaxID=3452206 RepID=UPI003F89713C